ncbi:unnamed protein product [Microthlaspi erraticum]|uniref:Uncharacterized protein n=1 Tax=Microthlaspi erraticum TaxID=1685480 RepID=A0A6D2K5I9_9BRAS|nr:unnamed protein product [Microthlaspi erraticum]
MASEGGTRADANDPAKTAGEEEKQAEEDDLAKSNDEGEVKTGEDDPAKITSEEEAKTEEARAEEDEAKEETSEGNGSPKPQEDSIPNIPGSDQTTNSGSTSIPPIGSPPVVASVQNHSNQSFGTQQQLSPRMVTTRPRSQVAHNSVAASFVPINAPRRPNLITRPFFPDQASMRPMMHNQPQEQIVPNILRGQAPMRPMMYNQAQDQVVPNILRGQAPMMHNQARDQVVPNVFGGQAPVRPMVYNN